MTLKTKLRPILLTGLLAGSGAASADSVIDVRHSMVASAETVSGSVVTFSLSVRNTGMAALRNISLDPANADIVLGTSAPLYIDTLAVGEEVQLQWSINSPLALDYLQNGAPLFFRVEADTLGQLVAFPVYSHGEAGL